VDFWRFLDFQILQICKNFRSKFGASDRYRYLGENPKSYVFILRTLVNLDIVELSPVDVHEDFDIS
jgi:hypothetical protein